MGKLMNQNIIFSDDFIFDVSQSAWRFTAQISGQTLIIYFHCCRLAQLASIDLSTKFDLEEETERWLKNNEYDSEEIHLHLD
tara:strand:- start:360 stop:605 length:246 start_codon:yes stop_codon:yes gene_type:complete